MLLGQLAGRANHAVIAKPCNSGVHHSLTVEEVERVGGGGGNDIGLRVPAEVEQLGGEVLGQRLLPHAKAAAAAAAPAAPAQPKAAGQLGPAALQPLPRGVTAGLQQAVTAVVAAHYPAVQKGGATCC